MAAKTKGDGRWMEREKAAEKKKGTAGALRKQTKTKAGKDIPEKALARDEKSKNPTTRKRAVLAMTFADFRKGK